MKKINPNWVYMCFDPVFVDILKHFEDQFFFVPVGNANDEVAPSHLLLPSIKLKYPQRDNNYCLMKSLASVFYYIGLKQQAHSLSMLSEHFDYLPGEIAIKEAREIVAKYAPMLGQCKVFNQPSGKKKKITTMSLEQLCLDKTCYPTLVLPCANDEATNHVFCVIDDLIFDSTQTCAMKLCLESINWICGKDGCDSILVAYHFN